MAKGQRADELLRELRLVREREGRIRGQAALAQLQCQVMGEQFLEREALLRRVLTGGELPELRLARRPVQVVECLGERGQSGRQRAALGEEVAQRGALDLLQRLGDESPQPSLRHALGAGGRWA